VGNPMYPAGSVRALLATEHVTPATRQVIDERLKAAHGSASPRYFDHPTLETLRAVVDRLIPQGDRGEPVDLAGSIDERLASGTCDGWRYAAMPPDGEGYRRGLRGLDEIAQARHGNEFAALHVGKQDEVLGAVQRGEVEGEAWASMPAARFFEELLAELCECYYSDPLSQEEIGYVGMADRPRWEAIGLGQLDPREPVALPVRRG